MQSLLLDRLLTVALLMLVCGLAMAQSSGEPEPIELTADSFAHVGSSTRVVFQNLKITQGPLLIRADKATASAWDFEHSDWHLNGDVTIVSGTAKIESNEANLTFVKKVLVNFELQGDPATFEDTSSKSSAAIQGTADRVEYDARKHRLSLTGHVLLKMDQGVLSGCNFIYDLDLKTFSSGTENCDGQIRFKATPDVKAPAAGNPPG